MQSAASYLHRPSQETEKRIFARNRTVPLGKIIQAKALGGFAASLEK